MKKTALTFLLAITFVVNAENTYDHGLFDIETNSVSLETEAQFIEFIKTNKPSTYSYYQRLSSAAQKRVFSTHQQNQNKDITEIVLDEYRNRG